MSSVPLYVIVWFEVPAKTNKPFVAFVPDVVSTLAADWVKFPFNIIVLADVFPVLKSIVPADCAILPSTVNVLLELADMAKVPPETLKLFANDTLPPNVAVLLPL